MQVVYEEMLEILFASREDLGLISISQISLSIKEHLYILGYPKLPHGFFSSDMKTFGAL